MSTAVSNEIVFENHDLNAIDFGGDGSIDDMIRKTMDRRVTGRTRVTSGWDAGEMGITYEDAAESFRRANTPDERRKVAADLRRRALERANLDVIDGRVALAAVDTDDGTDWHGLGTRLKNAMTTDEALKASGLDKVKMAKVPVSVTLNGETSELPGVYGISKTTTTDSGEEVVSVFSGVSVGEDYEVIPIKDCFDFMDNVIGDYGAHYDSVGSIAGGKKIFASVKMPGIIEPVPGDTVDTYTVLTNTYDGSGALWLYGSRHRPMCQNTERLAFSERSKGIRIRHTSNATTRVNEAKRALGLFVEGFTEFADIANGMAKASVDPRVFANIVLDALVDETAISTISLTAESALKSVDELVAELGLTDDAQREKACKKIERLVSSRQKAFDDIMTRYESKTCASAPGTVWAAYNAATEHANHAQRYVGKSLKRAETRFQDILTGRADSINQAAYSAARELVLAS